MIPNTRNSLLRRTAVALAAVAISLFSLPSSALTITLNGASGSTCTYTGTLTVDPAGNVSVTCAATTTTPGSAGTFSVSGPSSVTTGQAYSVTISRSGGSTDAILVNWATSGTGCGAAAGSTPFADGSLTSQSVTLTAGPTAATTCTFTITSVADTTSPVAAGTPPSIGTASVSTSVNAPTSTGGGTTPAGCPTVDPTTYISTTFPGGGPGHPIGGGTFTMPSGKIAAIALPPESALSPYSTGQVQMAYTALSPMDPALYEISISPCPGVIDTTAQYAIASCYYSSTNSSDVSLMWFGQAYSTITGPTSPILATRGWCWAGDPGKQYYANIRYTYSSCPNGVCGESVQWNYGGY